MSLDVPTQLPAIDSVMQTLGIPYAYGGAIAMIKYIKEPRATQDIDLAVYAGVDQAPTVLAALGTLGIDTDIDLDLVAEGEWARLIWDETPIDIFFSSERVHQTAVERLESLHIMDIDIPVISARDLVYFKVSFGRPKDWYDVETILTDTPGIDIESIKEDLNIEYPGRQFRKLLQLRLRQLDQVAETAEINSGRAAQELVFPPPTQARRIKIMRRKKYRCTYFNHDGTRCANQLRAGKACPAHGWTAPG